MDATILKSGKRDQNMGAAKVVGWKLLIGMSNPSPSMPLVNQVSFIYYYVLCSI
jgi:hypothetical protein